jgi:hypothetical protein
MAKKQACLRWQENVASNRKQSLSVAALRLRPFWQDLLNTAW